MNSVTFNRFYFLLSRILHQHQLLLWHWRLLPYKWLINISLEIYFQSLYFCRGALWFWSKPLQLQIYAQPEPVETVQEVFISKVALEQTLDNERNQSTSFPGVSWQLPNSWLQVNLGFRGDIFCICILAQTEPQSGNRTSRWSSVRPPALSSSPETP